MSLEVVLFVCSFKKVKYKSTESYYRSSINKVKIWLIICEGFSFLDWIKYRIRGSNIEFIKVFTNFTTSPKVSSSNQDNTYSYLSQKLKYLFTYQIKAHTNSR